MRGYKANSTHRTFAAWLLLVVFTLPMGLRTLHVCQSHIAHHYDKGLRVSCKHSVSDHHSATCALCSYTLLQFSKANILHVEMPVLPLIAIALPFIFITVFNIEIHHRSLRDPPLFALA